MNIILGLIALSTGSLLFAIGIGLLRYIVAVSRAQRYINKHQLRSGILVSHGMVIDKKTGLVRGTESPSAVAIRLFE